MKKLLNNPTTIENEMLDGIVYSASNFIRKVSDNSSVLVRAKKKSADKVALISGGGSGHEPLHSGYIGFGMLDAAVPGKIFTSPSANEIQLAIENVATDAGVLCIVKNYSGDVMNFEMAVENCLEQGIKVEQVIVNDDVAVKNPADRRGVAGTIFVHKIAGALAEQSSSLYDVQSIAQKVIDNVRTMGVAFSPCMLPTSGLTNFNLEYDEMEIGIGIHGEPGIRREKMTSTREIVDELLENILSDLDYNNHEVIVLVNGMGGSPLMELLIANKFVHEILERRKIKIFDTLVGNYVTSLEMQGFSITLLRLDDEMKSLYHFPTRTFAFQKYPEKF